MLRYTGITDDGMNGAFYVKNGVINDDFHAFYACKKMIFFFKMALVQNVTYCVCHTDNNV